MPFLFYSKNEQMKILFAILAIVCVIIVCGCYELQQQEHSDTISNVIACAFIMSGVFLALFFK